MKVRSIRPRRRRPQAIGTIGRAPIAPGDPGPDAESDRDLLMPNEREQAPAHVSPEPNPVIEQAARDLQAGLVDTDLRNTPGLDAGRRDALLRREGAGTGTGTGTDPDPGTDLDTASGR